MASEIRVNKIINRSGLSTVTFSDTGAIVSGIVTANSFSGNVTGNVTGAVTGSGANLTSIPAGQLTGTLPAISGANLTSLPAQATIANNADNRVITGGSGVNLNGESNLTFDGSDLAVGAGNLNVSKPAIPTVLVQNSTNTSFATVKLQQSSGSGGYFSINKLGTSSGAIGGANAAQVWQSGNAPIIFGVNNTEEVRFQSGGGISFNGDTAAANALDDYEEGNWGPNLVGLSNTPAYAAAQGKYTKIGRLVNLAGLLQGGGTKPLFTSQTDILKISGVPFAPNGSGYRHAYGSVTWQTTDWYGTNNNVYNYNQGQIAVGMSGSNLSFWISRATHDASGALISYATNKTFHNKAFIVEYNITYMTDA